MEVKASLKYARVGTLKARRVANLIRHRNVNEALVILSQSDLKPSQLFKGLVESAMANAEQKKVMDVDSLYIKNVFVNQGPSFKRFRSAAQGRAQPIKKKQSHLELTLSER